MGVKIVSRAINSVLRMTETHTGYERLSHGFTLAGLASLLEVPDLDTPSRHPVVK